MDSPASSTLRKILIAILAITIESTTPNRMPLGTSSRRCIHYLSSKTTTGNRHRRGKVLSPSLHSTMYTTAWLNTMHKTNSKIRQNALHSLLQLSPSRHMPMRRMIHQSSFHALRMMSSTIQHEIFPDSLQTTLSDEERAIYHELTLLSAKIRTLDEIYYGGNTNNNNGSLEVSDDEYDALARREAELCTLYPDLLQLLENDSGLGKLATRFGGRVGQMYEEIEKNLSGSDVDDVEVKTLKPKKISSSSVKRDKRRHLQNASMQSLDNAMDDVQVVAWLNRIRKLLSASEKADTEGEAADDNKVAEKNQIQVIAEPKIDGLSLSLRFQRRQSDSPNEIVYDFVWGATRGDGTQGEDVTEAVQSAWMKNGIPSNSSLDDHFSVPKSFTIPTLSGNAKTVDPPLIIEIRGEVVLPQKAFDEFVENATNTANSTLRTFSNARNAASGILLRSKEPTSQDEIERTKFLQSRLQFYAYDVVSAESEPVHQHAWPWTIVGNSGLTMREFLTSIGFQIPSPVVIESLDITIDSEINVADVPNLLNYHRNFMSIRDRSEAHKQSSEMTQPTFPYKIDGVVYKLVSFHQRTVCGSSSRTPRWAIAHKFPPLSAITRLLNMEVQVGRTGALTPVAILDPVDLGGVMVARASLHNFHFARKMLLPNRATSGLSDSDEIDGKCIRVMNVKKGVSVLVSRAGDVIPQVMKRVFDDDDEEEAIDEATHSDDIISLETPRSCPACGSPTSFEFVRMPVKKKKTNSKTQNEGVSMQTMSADNEESTDAESGQVLRCSGPQLLCQPRAMNALAYAYSRPGLDVKGLSKSKLNQLFEAGIIRFPSDLFSYFGVEDEGGEVLDRIADLPGWGELSSRNLAESIRSVASEGVPLSRYIYSLGIPLIGTYASQLLASTYGNIRSFLSALDEASLHDENEVLVQSEEVVIPQLFAALVGEVDGSGKVKGIGPAAISALLSFSKEEILMKAAKDLANVLTIHDDVSRKVVVSESVEEEDDESQKTKKKKPSLLKDMTVVFTGTIPGMSRTLAEKAAMKLGARATPSTVSKSTSLVVEGVDGGKKATKARELGVRVMDYVEFMKLTDEP